MSFRPIHIRRNSFAPILLALTVGLVSAPGRAIPVTALPVGVEYSIRSIRIEGARSVSRKAIRNVMQTRLPPWYKPWQRWWRKTMLNPAALRNDVESIRALLRESGYYEAKVEDDLVVHDHEVKITVTIDEGPATTVKHVDLVATDFELSAPVEQELRRLVTLKTGDVFTEEAYEASRNALERYFLERSYAYVTVEKAAVVDTATDEAAVTYTITRGPPAVFGTTKVIGLHNVAKNLVTREITWQPGEPYDPAKIESTQAAIFGLDLFRSVKVSPVNLAARTGTLDMAIEVVEGPPRSVKVGVGYGTEDEFRGQIQWRHSNFFGGGRQLAFQLKGSAITQSVSGEFRQPYFFHPQQTFVLPLTQARDDEPGYTVAQTRLAPRVVRVFPAKIKAALGYNIEYDDLSNVPDETKAIVEDYTARGFLSSVTLVVERNTADDLLDAHRGSVLNFNLEQAGGPWGADFTFVRALIEAKHYVPLPGERVLAGRLRIGTGDGFGQSEDLPMFRRFFSGGINSTRGYARDKLGPLTSSGDPIGGRSLLEGSVELRTPIWRALGMVAFVDWGLVDLQALRWDLTDLRFSSGPGIRYATPIGPIRLDVGFPLNPPANTDSWQIHFSIGQAF